MRIAWNVAGGLGGAVSPPASPWQSPGDKSFLAFWHPQNKRQETCFNVYSLPHRCQINIEITLCVYKIKTKHRLQKIFSNI